MNRFTRLRDSCCEGHDDGSGCTCKPMNAIEAFAKYAKQCGVDAKVDGFTLIQSGNTQFKLQDLKAGKEKKGYIDYLVNLKYPFKLRKQDFDKVEMWDILPSEGGVWFINNGAVILYVGIYELHAVKRRGMLVSASGHEEVAVVSLLQIEDSYTYYTR